MKTGYLKYIWDRYEDWKNPVYCKKCGTCGEVGCCGIDRFLREHIEGKTNCMYEESMVAEIRYAFKALEEDND
jgi:hypothetical protein